MIPCLFTCSQAQMFGCLHEAPGQTGLLIVSGGAQTRVGAQRGFLRLAVDIAEAGYPVFRFDRRGIGDSDGADAGFETAGEEIHAAIAELKRRQPHLRRIIGTGLCDGASALAFNPRGLAGMILLNPWAIDEGMPLPDAVVSAHYRRRLGQTESWRRLLRGEINFIRALGGMMRTVRPARFGDLAARLHRALTTIAVPVHLILSTRDRTADAFRPVADRLGPHLASRRDIAGDHVFSSEASSAALRREMLRILREFDKLA